MAVRPVMTCECGDHGWVCLTQGFVALIDPEFAVLIGLWNWKVVRQDKRWYAARNHYHHIGGKRRAITLAMHRVVLPLPHGLVVDHVSGQTLDNRRSNLRAATASQNALNQRDRIGLSKYRGVSFSRGKWRVVINVSGRQKYLGSFQSEIDAAQAYDREAACHHGEFARLNFSPADRP